MTARHRGTMRCPVNSLVPRLSPCCPHHAALSLDSYCHRLSSPHSQLYHTLVLPAGPLGLLRCLCDHDTQGCHVFNLKGPWLHLMVEISLSLRTQRFTNRSEGHGEGCTCLITGSQRGMVTGSYLPWLCWFWA